MFDSFGLLLLLDGVSDEQAGILLLIQQHHGSQVSDTLLTVARAGYHPNTLHLARRPTTPLNTTVLEILILLMPLGKFSTLCTLQSGGTGGIQWPSFNVHPLGLIDFDMGSQCCRLCLRESTTVQSVVTT